MSRRISVGSDNKSEAIDFCSWCDMAAARVGTCAWLGDLASFGEFTSFILEIADLHVNKSFQRFHNNTFLATCRDTPPAC
jgi:hypothetical protein